MRTRGKGGRWLCPVCLYTNYDSSTQSIDQNRILTSINATLSHWKNLSKSALSYKRRVGLHCQTRGKESSLTMLRYLLHVSQLGKFRVQTDCLANFKLGLSVTPSDKVCTRRTPKCYNTYSFRVMGRAIVLNWKQDIHVEVNAHIAFCVCVNNKYMEQKDFQNRNSWCL